jgi:hypothetical protein
MDSPKGVLATAADALAGVGGRAGMNKEGIQAIVAYIN